MDPYCGLHNSVWCHVCKDLESARHLQECKDEEEGEKWAFKACQIQHFTLHLELTLMEGHCMLTWPNTLVHDNERSYIQNISIKKRFQIIIINI